MWALDLGTSNTVLAAWDSTRERPSLVELPAVCRVPGGTDPLNAPRAIPSAVHLIDHPGFWARVSASKLLGRDRLYGSLAHIGRAALEKNQTRHHPAFAPTFKRALGRNPLETVARVGTRPVSAREVNHAFLRELLAETKRVRGERLRELVVTSPIEAFETYRAEVTRSLRALGVKRVRFLDEPIAAALGYGIGLTQRRRVLVVDFGGGTLHIACVELTADGAVTGQCAVLAKAARALGGETVDAWLLREFSRRLDLQWDAQDGEELRLWRRLLLTEARRVKEAVFFADTAEFELAPPEELRAFEARLRGEAPLPVLTRSELVTLLTDHGLYRTVTQLLEEVLTTLRGRGLGEDQLDDVLLVGGSTLLPGFYGLFEERFGRDRVRAWQPFEAVAYGATVFASERVVPNDFIVHDYALLVHDRKSQSAQHPIIIPRGTRFPTPSDFWKRQLVPTCSLGEPETLFKLVVCELGEGFSPQEDEARFVWDAEGRVHQVGGGTSVASAEPPRSRAPLVIPLNATHPTLGYLDPPHAPSDKRPRLEVSFGVNAERWLCATVLDLQTQRWLLKDEPVVRVL